MLDTRVSYECCTCYMTGSSGQEWPYRCRRQSVTVSDASRMKALVPKPQCDPSLLLLLRICYMLTSPALRQKWSWINPQMCEHFGLLQPLCEHVMAFMTPDQTAKTVAKFLWQGYISTFRALAKLLSDQGHNFESKISRELPKLMGIWKVRTSPYHAQTSAKVE